ncbi:MAG TPA: hypothetical protein VGS21_07800 [Acidimicrobiales bacterium]|nr:hypothetical protein [Acidimicrobiales bacterium]
MSETNPGRVKSVWRRAKLQVADDVRTRLEPDFTVTADRISALEQRVADLTHQVAVLVEAISALRPFMESTDEGVQAIGRALAAQLDTENESNELIGRLFERMAARVENVEASLLP